MRRLLCSLAWVLAPATLLAQVGHPPADSPYRDINNRHAFTLVLGRYIGADDPAGALPKSGPMGGVRYDTHIGGPAQLTARLLVAPTTRDELDPTRPEDSRVIRESSSIMTIGDVGININLTGGKSWRGLVPSTLVTVGLLSDFVPEDIHGYSLGLNFAFGYGGGLRYIPKDSRWEARADAHAFLSQSEYPASYFRAPLGSTPILPVGTPRSAWRTHAMLTLGVTYHVAR